MSDLAAWFDTLVLRFKSETGDIKRQVTSTASQLGRGYLPMRWYASASNAGHCYKDPK